MSGAVQMGNNKKKHSFLNNMHLPGLLLNHIRHAVQVSKLREINHPVDQAITLLSVAKGTTLNQPPPDLGICLPPRLPTLH